MNAKQRKDACWYALFTGPTVFVFLTVVIIPFIIGIYYSFFSWDGIPLNPKILVGFGNYIKLFGDARFIRSGGLTICFTLMTVIITNVAGLFLAIIVTAPLKTGNLARTMFFAPHLIGGLLLGFIWNFIFTDVFKALGRISGMEKLFFNWLIDPAFAMYALVIVNAWRMSGYVMIIYIAGIQNIPIDVLEAASIDGANYRTRLVRIVMPLLVPSFTIAFFLTISNAFKIYDVNLSLTNGGPSMSTELFAMNIYMEIFKSNNFGYGQSKAIVFFLFVAAISVLQTYITKKREVEMQ
ncbi:MAG: sugar ABC transporter permease [Treponema sp.]|nr:sugar ABC transporter permease [Treponema sp.]